MKYRGLRSLDDRKKEVRREKDKHPKNFYTRPERDVEIIKRRKQGSISDLILLHEFVLGPNTDADNTIKNIIPRLANMDVEIDVILSPVADGDESSVMLYTDELPEDPIKIIKAVGSLIR